MSRYASNCEYCGDRPGGCLYCVEQLENLPEDKLRALHQMIEDGEVHVVAVRTNQEILVRQVKRDGSRGRSPHQRPITPPKCTHHLWAHSGVMFKQRYCTRPGCGARQKFVWLPDDPKVSGKWVDVTAVTVVEKKPQRKAVRKSRTKQLK